MSGKDFIQLLTDIFPVENLHTRNLPGDNVKDEHPLVGSQSYIPMTGAVFWLGLRVERGAEVISAPPPV